MEHRLQTFQQNAVNRIRNETDEKSSRGKFTVDATISSKNYTILCMSNRHEEYLSNGLRTANEPFHRFTVSFILQ